MGCSAHIIQVQYDARDPIRRGTWVTMISVSPLRYGADIERVLWRRREGAESGALAGVVRRLHLQLCERVSVTRLAATAS